MERLGTGAILATLVAFLTYVVTEDFPSSLFGSLARFIFVGIAFLIVFAGATRR